MITVVNTYFPIILGYLQYYPVGRFNSIIL